MDDYIAKPLSPTELITVVETACEGDTDEPMGTPQTPDPGGSIIDRETILRRMMDDRELLAEMIDLFTASREKVLSQCRQAIADADREALRRAAHALKGMVANFDPDKGYQMAQELEMIGREGGEMAQAAKLLRRIERHIDRLQVALEALKEEGP